MTFLQIPECINMMIKYDGTSYRRNFPITQTKMI